MVPKIRRRRRAAVTTAVAGLLVALVTACGGSTTAAPSAAGGSAGSGPSVIPVIVSVEQAVGPNRLLFQLLDATTNLPIAAPDRRVAVAFTNPDGVAGTTLPGQFIWAIEGSKGVYVVDPTFDKPGTWKAAFATMGTAGTPETIVVSFDVRDKATTVGLGDKAPSVETPTLADVDGNVAAVSTDAEPVPAFYEHSVDELLAAGTPFVLAFATPKFCTSAQCGPTLEHVKAAAAKRPGFAVVNVEPYELDFVDGSLQPRRDANGGLIPVPATNAYGLVTEPWVFVIDGTGTIVGSFESVFSEDEMLAAIDKAAG